MLQLSVDGRNSEHVSRVMSLVETAKPPVRYSTFFNSVCDYRAREPKPLLDLAPRDGLEPPT